MIRNLYRDSVSLMQFSEKLRALAGITQASAVMATENNINLLLESSLLQSAITASPNDVLIVVEGQDEASIQAALDQAETLLKQKPADSQEGAGRSTPPRSIEMGVEKMPGANFALISTPGEYAAAEALKALRLGLHVMLFSDNVSLEAEIMLKQYARQNDFLVMGPDCGTAIINGIPLGFANVVRRGDIGIVAAAGTGLQQVSSLIDRRGGGVSQAIGTGSHDLNARVGGISMLQGMAALAADPATKVIVLISKPPSLEVAQRVLEQAAQSGKPVVVDFIGAPPEGLARPDIYMARTLDEAAAQAVDLSNGRQVQPLPEGLSPDLAAQAERAAASLTPGQKFIRGLFSGGTFCYETLLLLDEKVGPVYSNTPLRLEYRLADVWTSQGHTAIDLGDDLFTQGRPHPMIDFRLRNERIAKEAHDQEVGVILLDVVLGYGSNMDPAGELLPAIHSAQEAAARTGRKVVFVAFVCGTDSDPQHLAAQEQSLREAGVLLAESNAQAARLAAAVVNKGMI
jgi:succinyl-CoA synthetase alpha subunit